MDDRQTRRLFSLVRRTKLDAVLMQLMQVMQHVLTCRTHRRHETQMFRPNDYLVRITAALIPGTYKLILLV